MARNENIHVSLRFRPLSASEKEEGEKNIWMVSGSNVALKPDYASLLVESKRLTGSPKCYNYNTCFTSKESNSKVYETVGRRVVMASLEGYNGTIFAYGQTGSGKTYTMMGSEGADWDRLLEEKKKLESTPAKRDRRSISPFRPSKSPSLSPTPSIGLPREKGIVILALEDLFQTIKSFPDKTYYLTCSYMEIYNEQVFDLLEDRIKNNPLSVNEDPHRGFYVKGLSEHVVTTIEEVLKYIEKGETNRRYAITAMNHHSSRSHTIFRLNVTSVTTLEPKESKTTFRTEEDELEQCSNSIATDSVLSFVDLAGSERVSTTQEGPADCLISGTRKSIISGVRSYGKKPSLRSQQLDTILNEGKHINSSLFYLCQVINKLADRNTVKNDMHIPYRNSNLTRILRSSLGGNSLTCIICTATPTLPQFEMTLSTLRFGGKAKNITNIVEANIRSNKNAELLAAYQRDIETLRRELEIAQQGGRTHYEEATQMRKQLEDRIAKLTHMLFNQSYANSLLNKTSIDSKENNELSELWSNKTGILIMSSKLQTHSNLKKYLVSSKIQLKFDDQGLLALERLRALHAEYLKKEEEISNLHNEKRSLFDSKLNLKNDIKKIANLCKSISIKKQKYKKKCRQLREKNKILRDRLNLLEKQQGLEELTTDQLQQLEAFFYHGLDTIKNARFKRIYQEEFSQLRKSIPNRENIYPLADITKASLRDSSIGGILGYFENKFEKSLSSASSDSSLDFETSFYRNKRNSLHSSFESQEGSTLLFANILENEMNRHGKDTSSATGTSFPDSYFEDKEPLMEITSHVQNKQARFM